MILCIPLVIGLMIFCEMTAYVLDVNADHDGEGILIKRSGGGIMEMVILLSISSYFRWNNNIFSGDIIFYKTKAFNITKTTNKSNDIRC